MMLSDLEQYFEESAKMNMGPDLSNESAWNSIMAQSYLLVGYIAAAVNPIPYCCWYYYDKTQIFFRHPPSLFICNSFFYTRQNGVLYGTQCIFTSGTFLLKKLGNNKCLSQESGGDVVSIVSLEQACFHGVGEYID